MKNRPIAFGQWGKHAASETIWFRKYFFYWVIFTLTYFAPLIAMVIIEAGPRGGVSVIISSTFENGYWYADCFVVSSLIVIVICDVLWLFLAKNDKDAGDLLIDDYLRAVQLEAHIMDGDGATEPLLQSFQAAPQSPPGNSIHSNSNNQYRTVECIHKFTRDENNPLELSMVPGDQFRLLHLGQDGWLFVMRMRDGQQGRVPQNWFVVFFIVSQSIHSILDRMYLTRYSTIRVNCEKQR